MKDKNIENYLSKYKFTSREELAEKMGISERTVRDEISKLKQKRVVLYNSQTKGYRLARELRGMSTKELDEEIKLVERCIADINSRKEVFNKQLRKYIGYLAKAKEIKMLNENENHYSYID